MLWPRASDAPLSPGGLRFAAFVAVGYFLLAWFGLSLPGKSGFSSYIWPATGFAIACLLRAPTSHWPLLGGGIYLVSVVHGMRAGYPLLENLLNIISLVVALGNAAALQVAFKGRVELDSIHKVAGFSAMVVLVTAVLSALGGGYAHFVLGKAFLHEWRTWFISDSLGILVITPLVLAWSRPDREPLADKVLPRKLEVALLYLGLVTSTYLIYSSLPDPQGGSTSPAYVCVPFLVWAALRFGMRGATLALSTFAFITLWLTARGLGPYGAVHDSAEEAALQLQAYLGIVIVMILFVSAIVYERLVVQRENQSWRRRYEAAIEASESLVFDVDPASGKILWAGDTEKVLGIDESRIGTVRDWHSRVHEADRLKIQGLRKLLSTGELSSRSVEYRIRRDDDQYITLGVAAYSIELSGTAQPPGRHIIGFVKNITRKLQAEEERRVLEDRLRQAQKMEAIGRLAGGIAHDFNNILGAILGYGEMARNKAAADSDTRRHLDTILAAGERGKALVAQILTFSRARPAEKQTVLVGALIEEVSALLRASLPEGIALVVNVTDDELAVLGDVTQLHQLVMNLATNGMQSMTSPGRLGISAEETEIKAPHAVRLGQLKPGRYVVITVRDTGRGMDEALQARIFEPFFTTKPVGSGTGLGLSLAQSITLAHEGALDLQSKTDPDSDPGSAFTVYLPARETAADSRPAAAQAVRRGSGETVLVVDDEASLVRLLEDQLAGMGYEPIGFDSSESAWLAFEADPERFDAIISDEVMPGLTGTALAARVRAAGGRQPILLISGYGGPGFEIRAQAAGVTRQLRKPCSESELAEALAEALSATRLT